MRTPRNPVRPLIAVLLAALAGHLMPPAASAFPPSPPVVESPRPAYLFSYFTGNGEDGLHFATSSDGLTWTAVRRGASFLLPTVGSKLMRDPCIARGPDGMFHLVWTTGWFDQGIGLAHSRDLVRWSDQRFVPVMAHESGAQNAWAPELVYDPAARHWVIFWSSTIAGRFKETEAVGGNTFRATGVICNHRIYFTTTRDFATFAPTALLYDPGLNCIDATILPADGRWVMFLKDETQAPAPRKDIRVAWAESPTGPWGPASPPISPGSVEGPSVLRVGRTWFLYYDAYRRKQYEGLQSADLRNWTSMTERLVVPRGMRHGTAFAVPGTLVEAMERPP